MKKIIITIALVMLAAARACAQWAVIDVANLEQSITSYAALTEQISNQATQIANQVQQIQQFETQLHRAGSMSDYLNLVGFAPYRNDLNQGSQMRTWAASESQVNGTGIFGDTRDGVYSEVSDSFSGFDGTPISRDPQTYKPAQGTLVAVDEFKSVQSDVFTRRAILERAIAQTSDALQAATTDAEEQKLEAVLNAQYGQLATVDSEIALSAAEVQVKAAETNAMHDAQSQAEAESRRRIAQQEAAKLSAAFVPQYDCMLQYVTEKRLSL